MRDLTADLFVSLDGFASGVDVPPYFGLFGPDLGRWIDDELSRPQQILMGRVTYTALASIPAAADASQDRMAQLPKVVFSDTLAEPLAWGNARVMRGDAADGVRALKRESGDPLRTMGSLSVVRSLLAAGLVDRLRLVVFPILVGQDGLDLAFADAPRTGLELVNSAVLDGRLLLLDYRPAGAERPVRGAAAA